MTTQREREMSASAFTRSMPVWELVALAVVTSEVRCTAIFVYLDYLFKWFTVAACCYTHITRWQP